MEKYQTLFRIRTAKSWIILPESKNNMVQRNIPPSNEMQFAFGSTSFVVEPPRMAIKNILINRDSEESIIWKLNENNGNVASSNHENGRSWDGKVSDGVWIKEMHNHLKPVVSHKVYSNKFQFIGG